MSQRRDRPGSAGRSADSSPKVLIRAWYNAFLADTLYNYPSVDELPANFTDFDFVWSTFQTSNRKLRGTVVELTDFERETVLEFLRDELHVLEFDNAKEAIVWHPDQLEQVAEDQPAAARRPWSQATNDWGTPKPSSRADEQLWNEGPSHGTIDPAWQFSWAGKAASSTVVKTNGDSRLQQQPPPVWGNNAAAKTDGDSRRQQQQPPSVRGKNAATTSLSVTNQPPARPSTSSHGNSRETHRSRTGVVTNVRDSKPAGADRRDARQPSADTSRREARQPSADGRRRDARQGKSGSGGDASRREPRANHVSDLESSKTQAEQQLQQRRQESKSSGPVERPPLKRPSDHIPLDSTSNHWASIAKGSAGKKQVQSGTQEQAGNAKSKEKIGEKKGAVEAAKKAAAEAARKEAAEAAKKATAEAAKKAESAKKPHAPPKEERKPKPAADEPASWKKAESSEKKGSGMAMLGFDYM